MSRFISIFTFLYCLSQACWAAPQTVDVVTNSTRIIGGSPASIQTYPFAAQVNLNNQLICGGSLVSRRCVLSAAHCFVDRYTPRPNPSLYSVRLGTSTLGSGGIIQQLSTIVVHERYNFDTHENDVAVMVLRANATLSATVGLAFLPPPIYRVPDNSSLVHIGWGRTQVNSTLLSPSLLAVTVRKVNHSICAARYGPILTTNMICAGLLGIGGADACQGDSGGPLLQGYLVVGVTSWGAGCADPYFPGVSARVANYSDWINTQITRYNASPALSVVNALVLMVSLAASLVVLQ